MLKENWMGDWKVSLVLLELLYIDIFKQAVIFRKFTYFSIVSLYFGVNGP